MVAIVADSAANLPGETARALGIEIVPMYLKFGEGVYRDGRDLTPGDFYRRLVNQREPATTSVPSPGDFLEAFRRTGQEEILCVTIASSMSSSFQQASFAAERFDGRVEVLDSATASMAEGFVAIEAARAAGDGADLGDVSARATDVSRRVRLVATIGTFEFLRRSGRVNALQAYAATMLDIKPVFGFRGGDAVPIARTRTRRRALERIRTEALREASGGPLHLAVVHAAAEEEARALLEAIEESTTVAEGYLTEVTPVIGAHTGPGLVGAAFYRDRGPAVG